ncbi:MAG: hypothetical protein GXP16_06270, partial [Gammaproteobacteria bacterium]|nr:hypothetical protein [Gammaproteobacteria bacterium]
MNKSGVKASSVVEQQCQRYGSSEELAAAVAKLSSEVAGRFASEVDQMSRFPQESIDALRAVGALG